VLPPRHRVHSGTDQCSSPRPQPAGAAVACGCETRVVGSRDQARRCGAAEYGSAFASARYCHVRPPVSMGGRTSHEIYTENISFSSRQELTMSWSRSANKSHPPQPPHYCRYLLPVVLCKLHSLGMTPVLFTFSCFYS
jgi:hypothetical protein